jgi:hypothetical protein
MQQLDAYYSTSHQAHGKRTQAIKVYAPRKTSVEPVFGQIKSARALDRSSCQGWSR